MSSTVTLNLDEPTAKVVDQWANENGQTREQVIMELIQRRRQLQEFRSLQQQIQPYAERAGVSEADILREVS